MWPQGAFLRLCETSICGWGKPEYDFPFHFSSQSILLIFMYKNKNIHTSYFYKSSIARKIWSCVYRSRWYGHVASSAAYSTTTYDSSRQVLLPGVDSFYRIICVLFRRKSRKLETPCDCGGLSTSACVPRSVAFDYHSQSIGKRGPTITWGSGPVTWPRLGKFEAPSCVYGMGRVELSMSHTNLYESLSHLSFLQ